MTTSLNEINQRFIEVFGCPTMPVTQKLLRWVHPDREFSIEQRGKRFVNVWITPRVAEDLPVWLQGDIRPPDAPRIHNLTPKARVHSSVARVKIKTGQDVENAIDFIRPTRTAADRTASSPL